MLESLLTQEQGVNMSLAQALIPHVTLDRANEYLVAKGLPKMEDHDSAIKLIVKSSGVSNQRQVAALAVNLTEGHLSNAQMTEIIRAADPNAKVGDRHGSYYMSQCRTGKIKVDDTAIPAKGGGSKVTVVTAPAHPPVLVPDPRTPILEARVGELEALVSLIKDCKSIKEVRALLEPPVVIDTVVDEVPPTA